MSSRLLQHPVLLERALESLQSILQRFIVTDLNLRQKYPSLPLPIEWEQLR